MTKRKLSSLVCAVCRDDYDADAHIPLIGSCGHSICATCVASIKHKCPLCNKPKAFASQNKNFQLIEVITEMKDVLKKRIPRDPKDCRRCADTIDDDKAFAYISSAIPDGSESVEPFLEKAKAMRFCEACALAEEEPGRFRRIQDIEKTLTSKKLAMSLDREKDRNLDLCNELQEAVSMIWNARSSLDEGFPRTKKFGQDCTEQEMKEIEAVATARLKNANISCEKAAKILYTAALQLNNFSAATNRHPKAVNYDALDEEILKKVRIPPMPVPTPVSRPKPPQSAFTFYCKENRALVEKGQSQTAWSALEDKSGWINKETEDVERYNKAMIAYFRR